MRTIKVKTASAEYPVYVGSGLLKDLYRKLPKQRPIFVLTSPEIWGLWSKRFLASFPPNAQPVTLFLPPGEQQKRMAQVERLATELSDAGADRGSILIAFGGGIVGDLGGFLAAIYMRGMNYVQIPSTLLAQVDSSVGGKTGVNLTTGKNLVGSFHHPLAVYADVDLLQTLPERELRAGLFESIKAGVIRDAKLFRFMERHRPEVLGRDTQALEQVIAASIRMKAEVVGLDERESGLRMILNFGHTLGHAIEAVTHYRKLLHGEAIAWGMIAAVHLAKARKTVTPEEAARISAVIHSYGPLPPFRASAQKLVEATGRDKKNRFGVRRFILPVGIGDSQVIEDVTDAELFSASQWMLNQARKA
jgi:3-dehydroquinate synthase